MLSSALRPQDEGRLVVICTMHSNQTCPELAVSICFELCLKIVLWAKEIAHQLRAFAAHTEDTGLVSDNHMVDLECLDLQLQGSDHFPLLISGGTKPINSVHTCLQANRQTRKNEQIHPKKNYISSSLLSSLSPSPLLPLQLLREGKTSPGKSTKCIPSPR